MAWRIPQNTTFADDLATKLGVDPTIAARIISYKLRQAEAERFLRPQKTDIRQLQDVLPGLPVDEWIDQWQAIANSHVAVFSDYDVDGSSSAEIVARALTDAGATVLRGSARVEDGFGVSDRFIDEIIAANVDWLITLDCGSTQGDQIGRAKDAGIRTVVIDHHGVDPANPVDMHCNPAYARLLAAEAISNWLAQATDLLDRVGQATARQRAGLDHTVPELAVEAKELLNDASEQFGVSAPKLQRAIVGAEDLLAQMQQPETLTGSGLSWMWVRSVFGESEWLWTEGIYLAGLGAIGDMASMRVIETRALCRLGSDYPPQGIQRLAALLEEDPTHPAGLIRTRAALNLAKRTVRVRGEDIAQVYAGDEFAPVKLAGEYTQASSRKDIMLEYALEHVSQDGWASVVLDDWPADAGQSGVIAQKLAGTTGRPAIVFAKRDDGKYKFSCRNGKRNPQKIGVLIEDQGLVDLSYTDGENGPSYSLGGHEDVVSGACEQENITAIIDYINAWLPSLSAPKKYGGDIWVNERLVPPARVSVILEQLNLLEPLANDSWGVDISVKARLHQEEEESWLELENGDRYDCTLDEAATHADDSWMEWKIRLRPGKWWLREYESLAS